MESIDKLEIVDGPDPEMMGRSEWQLWVRPQGSTVTVQVHAELTKSAEGLFSGRIGRAQARRENVEWINEVTCTYKPRDGALVKGLLQGPDNLAEKIFPAESLSGAVT